MHAEKKTFLINLPQQYCGDQSLEPALTNRTKMKRCPGKNVFVSFERITQK